MSPTASDAATTPVTANQIAAAWTDMWNGSFDLAHRLCASEFRIFFGGKGIDGVHPGDAVHDAADLVEFLHAYHASHPGVRFVLDGESAGELGEGGTGLFAVRWYADLSKDESVSGIDMLEAVGGTLTRVWSLGAERRFPTA